MDRAGLGGNGEPPVVDLDAGVGPTERTGKSSLRYCPGGRSGVDRPRPEKPRETMPTPGPYADSGGPSSGRRQALSCPRVGAGLDLRGGATGEVTKSQPSGPCEGFVSRSTAPVPVADSAVAPRPIVEAHIHPVGGVGR